jgi:ABC-2 type transport system permease protein
VKRISDVLPAAVAAWVPARVGRHRLAWLAVARKDIADAGRSWLLYALAATFLAFMGLGAATPPIQFSSASAEMAERLPPLGVALAIDIMITPLEALVPLTALVVGYRSIIGEQEQRSLQVLLGLPVTRRDLFVGKLVGRSVVVVGTMLVGFVGAAVVIAGWYETFEVWMFLEFVGLTVFLAVVSTAIAVGISGFARSRARAMGGAIVTFATFTFFWQALPASIHYLQKGEIAPQTGVLGEPVAAPAWFVFLRNVKLQRAYKVLVHEWVTPVFRTSPGTEQYGDFYVEGTQPFYLEPWFSAVVLVAWAALFLGLGYWRFSRADLD